MTEVLPIITQFGAAGLIGVLWIVERRHALVRDRQLDEAHRSLHQLHAERESLLSVVKDNTRAMAALEGAQRQLVRLLESLTPPANANAA